MTASTSGGPASGGATARRTLGAAGVGLVVGGAIVLLIAFRGQPSLTDLGGMCVASSPLQTLTAPDRPCQRLALNLVTLPYLTGLALLFPRMPGRLAVRILHTLAAAAPVLLLAAIATGGPPLVPDAGAMLALAALAATAVTGLLHLAGSLRRGRTVHMAHLALAGLWLALGVGSNLVDTLARH